jgi:hypothetical protein
MVRFLGMFSMILWIIRNVAELVIPEKMKRENADARNGLYLALTVVEYGYVVLATGLLCAGRWKSYIHDSVLYFDGADIKMDAKSFEGFVVDENSNNTPAAGFSTKTQAETVDGDPKKWFEKINWEKTAITALATLGTLGILATGAGRAGVTDEELVKELNSL